MTGRARTAGQIFAIGAVALLLGLLVWKLAFGSGGGAADELAKGKHPTAPAFELNRLDVSGGAGSPAVTPPLDAMRQASTPARTRTITTETA
jgi:hypothetical protein